MPLSLQQVQKLSQRLIMTPQMQMSVKLLQMTAMELEEMTQQEILENPFLEMEEDDYEAPPAEIADPALDLAETAAVTSEASPADDFAEIEPVLDDTYETAPVPTSDKIASGEAAEPEIIANQVSESVESTPVEEQPEQFSEVDDTDWSEVFEDGEPVRHASTRNSEDADERSYEETVAGTASLYEVIERQLRLSALEGKDLEIGYYLIGCINESGYLETTLEECAERFETDADHVRRILRIIQEFEPTGVGARNLPECLKIQLTATGKCTPLASRILDDYWDFLLKKKLKEIARALKTEESRVMEAFRDIQKMDPNPGRQYSKEQAQYISPDVYVKKIDGKYICYLNEGQIAHLRLSNTYKEILMSDAPGRDPKEKEYALEKYRAAVMFIKNIEKRRSTVLKVTQAIMDYQQEFLEHGVEALRPLALSEIANVVSMHESTISRVTSTKYVDTPQGLFQLKFFFSSAIESNSGEAASSRSIKQMIQELVNSEDPKRPLSDDKIASLLLKSGFSIARRTVAKYREQLRILPTNMRRKAS
jgi:RNA polymerase sigma-54 factor